MMQGHTNTKFTTTKNRILTAQVKGWTKGSRFHSRQGLNFCFTIASTPALWPTQWLPEKLSLEVKWSDREADRSTPCSAEIKIAWSRTSTPNTPSWRGAYARPWDARP